MQEKVSAILEWVRLERSGLSPRREFRCRSLGPVLVRTAPCEEKDDGFEPARNADLAEDVLEVSFDRVAGETQVVRHLFVGLAEHEEIHNLMLARAQVQP